MPATLRTAVFAILALLGPAVAANPGIEHWTTGNGGRVYYVHAPEIPMVDIRMVFAAGSARDEATPGLAALTSALITEGAGALDADAFHARIEATGARFSAQALRETAWASLRSLVDPACLDPALALMRTALTEPRFDAAAFARQRDQALAGLKSEQESPADIADKAMFKAIYGTHPYASPISGTAASVAGLTSKDVAAFFERYYVAQNAVIAIVGAVDRADAARIAEALTEEMPAGTAAPPVPEVAALTAAQALHIEFPSLQSHVLLGQPGMTREDPDYFPLLVGNHVLGGNTMVSLLFEEIREKRGLSYSVDSSFEPMAQAGPFIASLQTKGSQQAEALKVMRETMARFIAEGPTEAALEAAKKNLIGGFPLRIDNNAKILEYLAMIGFYGLPLDYLDRYPERVRRVTVAEVRDAFKRRIDLARMAVVTVGRAAAEQTARVAPVPPG